MTDKMPDEKLEADESCTLCRGYGFYVIGSSGSAEDGDAPIYEDCDCAIKYISEQKHAEEIAALKAEHRAEMAGLCDEIEDLKEIKDEFETPWEEGRRQGVSGTVDSVLELIKQRISDE